MCPARLQVDLVGGMRLERGKGAEAFGKLLQRTKASRLSSEAIASIGSLKAIIAAYIDETGVFPANWDDLNSISAIMGIEGEMTGAFSKKWVLPSKYHEIMVLGPTNAIYNIKAEPLSGCENRSIKACLNSSTGASKLSKGDGTTNALDVVCT